MIKFLRVRNLATIEDLELALDEGFSVLTGETGAGKSIIIDAIRLILGEKGSADLVRTGRSEAFVEAVFDVSGQPLDLAGLPDPEEGELLVQRSVTDQGTGKAFVNGVLVPVRRLREIGARLIDIYGQNDHVFLLHLENHLGYLDETLDDRGLVRDTARSAQELRRLLQEKRDLETREKERAERLDFIAYQLGEIEAAGLKPGEDESLLRERDILRNSEKIAGLVDRALDVAYLGEDSLVPRLARLRSILGELAAYDAAFGDFRPGLEEASILLQDAADALVRFKDRRAAAPEDPEAVEERLSVIEKLKRKYGGTIEAVLARGEDLRRERDRARVRARAAPRARSRDRRRVPRLLRARGPPRRRAEAGRGEPRPRRREGDRPARHGQGPLRGPPDRGPGLDRRALVRPRPGRRGRGVPALAQPG